jgi:hypothetical protein
MQGPTYKASSVATQKSTTPTVAAAETMYELMTIIVQCSI